MESANVSPGNAGPDVPNSPRRSLLPLAALVLITAAGTGLRLHALTAKGFWFDEGVSVGIARLDWFNFARLLWRREGNMSLYYLLLRPWLHFGGSEAYVRSLSVICAVAAIPALYLLGRRLFDARAGLIAATLLAVNAYHVRYAQEARSYALMVLLCILSNLYFLQCLDRPTRENRVVYIAISALSVYAHFFSILFIIAQWLSLRFLDVRRMPAEMRNAWRWILLGVFPVLAFVITTGAGPIRWIERPGIKELWAFIQHLCGNADTVAVLAFTAAVAAAVAPAWPTRMMQRVPWEAWRERYLLLWLFFPPLLALAASVARPVFLPRYLIPCLPALLLLAAAGLARLRPAWLLALAVLLFVAMGVRGTDSYYQRDFDLHRENWRAGSQYLLNKFRPDDGLIFHAAPGRLLFDYYRSLSPPDANVPAVLYPHHGPNITFLDLVEKPDYAKVAQSLPQHPRIWLVLSHAREGSTLDLVSSAMVRLLSQTYSEAGSMEFDGLELRLYSDPQDRALCRSSRTQN